MSRLVLPGVFFAAVLLAACGEQPSEPELSPDGILLQIISGNAQTGTPGEELPEPLVVRAIDSEGHALNHLVVSFVPTLGGGSAWAGAANTDPHGYAREYWTLGPLPGENRMEARVVDPRTGDKLMLGEFVAEGIWAVPPSTEICDGIDNDQDGEKDENLTYCVAGLPAPHTDGEVCDAGYIDRNGDPADGCETLDLDGTYALDPVVSMECPGFPVLGTLNFSLSSVDLTILSNTDLRLAGTMQAAILPLPMELELPYDPNDQTFGGEGTFTFGPISGNGYTIENVEGSINLNAGFVDAGIWSGTVSLTTSMVLNVVGISQTITCTPVENLAVTATRQ